MKKVNFIFIVLIILISCKSSDSYSGGTFGLLDSKSFSKDEIVLNEEKVISNEQNIVQPKAIKPEKIIKTADIKFEVPDYKKSKTRIDSIVNFWGGFISNENERNSNYQIINNIVIRVSNINFENLLNDIGETSSRIDYKRINSIDVTEEYVDISSRLKTKKEVQERYRALLKNAVKIEDILKIENEIRIIQEEIEVKEGRLKFLDSRVSFSTINLEIYQVLEYRYKPKKELNFLSRLYKALDNGWKGLLSFIVGIMNIWPIILIVVSGLVIYFRVDKKRKSKK